MKISLRSFVFPLSAIVIIVVATAIISRAISPNMRGIGLSYLPNIYAEENHPLGQVVIETYREYRGITGKGYVSRGDDRADSRDAQCRVTAEWARMGNSRNSIPIGYV